MKTRSTTPPFDTKQVGRRSSFTYQVINMAYLWVFLATIREKID